MKQKNPFFLSGRTVCYLQEIHQISLSCERNMRGRGCTECALKISFMNRLTVVKAGGYPTTALWGR